MFVHMHACAGVCASHEAGQVDDGRDMQVCVYKSTCARRSAKTQVCALQNKKHGWPPGYQMRVYIVTCRLVDTGVFRWDA